MFLEATMSTVAKEVRMNCHSSYYFSKSHSKVSRNQSKQETDVSLLSTTSSQHENEKR
jgi:hypothetical protein